MEKIHQWSNYYINYNETNFNVTLRYSDIYYLNVHNNLEYLRQASMTLDELTDYLSVLDQSKKLLPYYQKNVNQITLNHATL